MPSNPAHVLPEFHDHDPIRDLPESMAEIDRRFMHGILHDMHNQAPAFLGVRGLLDVSRETTYGVPLIYPPGLGYISSHDQGDVLEHSKLPFVSVSNAVQMYDFILGNDEDHGLVPKQEEIDLFRRDPNVLAKLYRDASLIHKLRVADFLLDVKSTNMFGFWANLNDHSFQEFFAMVKVDQLPRSLTSDQEMTRLLTDRRAQAQFEYPEGEQAGTREATEPRPSFYSARFRLLDLVLSHEEYGRDEMGRIPVINSYGGPPGYLFDSSVDIQSIMSKLGTEFREG